MILLLSIRSPGPVSPEDVECEGFDITYTRIAGDKSPQHGRTAVPPLLENNNDIHVKVDYAIEGFLKNLSQIGPELLSVRTVYRETWRALLGKNLSC